MKLEQFIQTNRDAFEQGSPSAQVWERLAAQLPITNVPEQLVTNPFRAIHRGAGWARGVWAASVAVLLLAAGLWWVNDRYAVVRQPDLVAVSPGYAKEMAQYASLIDTKRFELQQLTTSNPALYGQFEQDLKHLDTSYQGLRHDLPDTPNQEVLIQAMIQNLQLQIDLLNEQLRVIQRIKQQRTPNEPV